MVTIPSSPHSISNLSGGTFGAFRAPEIKKRRTRPFILLVVLIIILAATGYYFFTTYGFITLQASPVIPPAKELNSVELRVIGLPAFNFDVADSALYKSLKLHGAIPIKIEALGRINPFSPF